MQLQHIPDLYCKCDPNCVPKICHVLQMGTLT